MLVIDKVTRRFGAKAAVSDVSLQIADGAFIGVIGRSGAGKSTLLRMINRLADPTEGRILADGRDVTALAGADLRAWRQSCAMIFQQFNLVGRLDVLTNVLMGRLNHVSQARALLKLWTAEDKAIALSALEQFDIGSLASQRAESLSGGQQQRVALARAMVFTPHLLLLDEPLSALDKKLRAELQDELKRLHRRVGLTFIYVTHDQDEALSMSDRIVVMRDGRVVQQGSPTELYDRPATTFVADFLGKSNFLRGKVEALAPGGFVLAHQGARIAQASADGEAPAVGTDVVIALRPEKVGIVRDGEAADNRLKGVVSEWNYFGSQFRLVVDTLEFGPVAVVIPAWKCGEPPAIGAPLTLAFERDAGTLVADG